MAGFGRVSRFRAAYRTRYGTVPEISAKALPPRSVDLDDGRSIVVGRDGTITLYSADRRQRLVFKIRSRCWEINVIGLIG
jgi:hypothetical protein